LLAIYIAVWQVAPDLMPAQLRPGNAQMLLARSPATGPARAQQDRLVAVLQPGPSAPAFLLTLDTQQRTLTVRKVSATAEAGKSYELWLISSRLGAPRSLGTVGNDEFTQRPLPGNYDVDTLRAATYAVSLEPAGGSKSGAPTGPVLFTGKAVESLPASPVQTPKT
jgi:anti-sigma-K factor RskA